MTTSTPAQEVSSAARRDCAQPRRASLEPSEGTAGDPRKVLGPGILCRARHT